MKKDNKIKWYDSGKNIVTFIIIILLLTIICSQAFAVVGSKNVNIITSVISHNTIYLLILIYFIGLKTYAGKKYFNYLNVFLMFIYLVLSITSFLTVVQSFSLNTILSFSINIIVLIYMFHTMFRDTRVWREFKLGNSPFNEITNDVYFNTLIIMVIISLFVNSISTVVISGLIISILNALFVTFLGRYIYLYRSYLDNMKKDINNDGNFDSIKKDFKDDLERVGKIISDVGENVKEKADDVVNIINSNVKNNNKKKNSKGDK